MNNEQTLRLISELKNNEDILNELKAIAINYNNNSIPHNLDKKVLFQIEVLHEKISTILMNLYMADLKEDFLNNQITEEEYTSIIESPFAKYIYMTHSFLYNEQYIKDFSVNGKFFSFNLNESSCYYISKGKCSLDIDEKELKNILKEEFKQVNWYTDRFDKFLEYAKGEECSVVYCRNIANSIKSKGIKSPAYIEYFNCNHYGFTDGQHRACIASKLNLPLPIYLSDMTSEDTLCPSCTNKTKKQNTFQYNKPKLKNNIIISSLDKLLNKFNMKKNKKVINETLPDNFESVFLKKL